MVGPQVHAGIYAVNYYRIKIMSLQVEMWIDVMRLPSYKSRDAKWGNDDPGSNPLL